MTNREATAALLLLATLSATATATAQTVTVTVMDSTSNTRVSAARILVLQVGSSYSAITDSSGRYRFRVREGIFSLQISALGYAHLRSGLMDVGKNENVTLLAFLTAEPVEIAPVFVIARSKRLLSGVEQFRERMHKWARMSWATFIDEITIRRRNALEVTDLLKWVPGARVERDYVALRPYCSDALYLVDGMPVHPARGFTATDQVNLMVSPQDVAGIEIYKSETALPGDLQLAFAGQLSDSTSCGVVAIWMKR